MFWSLIFSSAKLNVQLYMELFQMTFNEAMTKNNVRVTFERNTRHPSNILESQKDRWFSMSFMHALL